MSDVSVSENWLSRRPKRSKTRLRLFCFPYAGGNSMIFRTWQADLPDTIEVCPLQLPGRAMRMGEASFTRLSPLIQALGPALQPYLDLPFAFFGHSLGALVSFELARWLCQQGGPSPCYLFVSAHEAPQIPRADKIIYHLPDNQFLEKIRRYEGTPEEVFQHPELMDLLLPVLRADFEIYGTYAYKQGKPLACPISAFGGTLDPLVTQEDLAAWCEQTSSTFQMRIVSGNHFFLHAAQSFLLQSIVSDLRQFL